MWSAKAQLLYHPGICSCQVHLQRLQLHTSGLTVAAAGAAVCAGCGPRCREHSCAGGGRRWRPAHPRTARAALISGGTQDAPDSAAQPVQRRPRRPGGARQHASCSWWRSCTQLHACPRIPCCAGVRPCPTPAQAGSSKQGSKALPSNGPASVGVSLHPSLTGRWAAPSDV